MGHLLNFLLICFYMQCHQRKWCQPGMFSKSHFIISCLFMKLRVWLWCDHHTSFPVLPGERLRINLFFFSLVGLAWVRDPTQAIAVTWTTTVTTASSLICWPIREHHKILINSPAMERIMSLLSLYIEILKPNGTIFGNMTFGKLLS